MCHLPGPAARLRQVRSQRRSEVFSTCVVSNPVVLCPPQPAAVHARLLRRLLLRLDGEVFAVSYVPLPGGKDS